MFCRSTPSAEPIRFALLTMLLLLLVPLGGCGDDKASDSPQQKNGSVHSSPEEPPALGRWHRREPASTEANLTAEQKTEIRRLQTIGYASGSVEPTTEKVITIHDASQTYAGLNFYTSGHASAAILVDMDGRALHSWQCSFKKAWPESPLDVGSISTVNSWRRAYLYPNGDILAIFEGLGLVKLNKNSEVIWATRNGAHHDLEVMPDGKIYVLARTAHMVPRIHRGGPILEDFVIILDEKGNELKRVSILECVENSKKRLENVVDMVSHIVDSERVVLPDLFHTNTLEVLDDRNAKTLPAFQKGNVLISLRTLDRIAVIDLEQERMVWLMQRNFKAQHDPTILPNGNLILFDNQGTAGKSAAREFDLTLGKTRWEYFGSGEHPFYSETCGTVQRLPNGNTLITESDHGRAFEVTADKEIVWEFYNPHRAGENGQYIATLFEMKRLPPDFPTDWVAAKKE